MIKKLLLISFLTSLSSSLFAQIDTKLNLVGLAAKKIEISAEAGHDKLGLEFTFGYHFKKWTETFDFEGNETIVPGNGFLLGFRPNYYFKPKTTLKGFYMSPYSMFSRYKIDYQNKNDQIHTKATVGVVFGYKGRLYEQLFWSAETGTGYNFIYKYADSQTKERISGEETIPFFGGLTKIHLPFRVSIIYRIGEQ